MEYFKDQYIYFLFDSSESLSRGINIVSDLIGLVSSIILGDSSLNWNPSEIKNGMACEYDPYV